MFAATRPVLEAQVIALLSEIEVKGIFRCHALQQPDCNGNCDSPSRRVSILIRLFVIALIAFSGLPRAFAEDARPDKSAEILANQDRFISSEKTICISSFCIRIPHLKLSALRHWMAP